MSTAVRQFYVCDAKKQEERKDKLIRSPPPEVVQIDSDTDLSGGEDSDLSQGKVEDLLPSGLDGKYLQHSLDIMRCQDPHMSQDRSYALSTHTEAKGWHSDSTACDVEGWIEGLPSTLLQPQHSLLNECNEKEIDSLSKLASREWDTRDEVLKTASFDDDYDDDAFVSNKVRFDAGQISARSTIFGNELEESTTIHIM
ncbi:uncharacterized protein LOC121863761 [Homarus americanus]|uniref:uncharacterized protein LOC121863761 n=1 Tax=Homarus americanus TaxID=6706 RepID=UPI001C43BB18|nr:uncharacterized protein LOC121863761 [Homarus americanus]